LKRFFLFTALLLGLVVLIVGCGSNTQVATITLTPSTQSLAAGQTAQFTATGTIPHGKHPATTEDVTSLVSWSSSSASIATINASGVATAVSAGSVTITASMAGATPATATVAVTGSTGGGGGGGAVNVVTVSVIPGSQAVAAPKQTSQFIAIGTTASGATVDLSGLVSWTSSSTSVATITAGGLATGVGQGTSTITAVVTNADKTVATGVATFTVTAGTQEPVTAIAITPSAQSLSASGQTGQFVAIATTGSGLTQDVTNSAELKWQSSVSSVASITSGGASGNGVATGTNAGTTTITAVWTNPDSSVVSSAPATVTVSLTAPPNPLLSLVLIPTAISVGDLQDTGQFLAIGTFSSSPYVQDVTNSPNTTWISTFPDSFPVSTNSGGTSSASAGIVTAYGTGTTTIIAEYKDPATQTVQTATATFACPLVLPDPTTHPPTPGSCWTGQTGPLKATLTVYGEGLNTTNWLITAPSATATSDVIHCGPGWTAGGNAGGSVCTGIYPNGTTVLLTAPAQTGVAFGGWTYNCTPTDANGNPLPGPVFWTAAGPNYCKVTLTSTGGGSVNATVGAIFNNQ
jgi:hypothetical protein